MRKIHWSRKTYRKLTLGKFDQQKARRPLLVQLQSVDAKITLFKNVHYMKALPKYKDINVSNDLAKTERAREKELWEEAKNTKDKDDSGNYEYKVRGPSWARKVAKKKK